MVIVPAAAVSAFKAPVKGLAVPLGGPRCFEPGAACEERRVNTVKTLDVRKIGPVRLDARVNPCYVIVTCSCDIQF